MEVFNKWVLPIVFAGIGIAVLAGWILPQIPRGLGVRFMIGLIAVLMGIYRFAAARTPRSPRRRYGGNRERPWEKE